MSDGTFMDRAVAGEWHDAELRKEFDAQKDDWSSRATRRHGMGLAFESLCECLGMTQAEYDAWCGDTELLVPMVRAKRAAKAAYDRVMRDATDANTAPLRADLRRALLTKQGVSGGMGLTIAVHGMEGYALADLLAYLEDVCGPLALVTSGPDDLVRSERCVVLVGFPCGINCRPDIVLRLDEEGVHVDRSRPPMRPLYPAAEYLRAPYADT